MGARWVCLAAAWFSLGARADAPPGLRNAGGGGGSQLASPLALPELRTTDGAIALRNLQAQIEGEERLAHYGPPSVSQRAGIADLIAMRGQFLGRIADYERAEALAEQLVRDAPNDGGSYLARAHARSIFHRFPEALADLAQAQRLGASAGRIESARAAILQATGRYDEALAIRRRAARERRDITSLGAEASLSGERGEVEEAERLFAEALRRYRDVSPFPVAWICVQWGLMWQREGQLERARVLFEAAHERLSAFAVAQGHLAEVEAALGRPERAIALLRPLAASSDDPDYAAQLARILSESGHAAEARHWRDRAAARFEELLVRHPAAFADHAAEFWLAAGGDPKKALALAQNNLGVRPTPRAYELVLQSALAAGETAMACAVLDRVRSIERPWPSLRMLTSSASARCGPTFSRP